MDSAILWVGALAMAWPVVALFAIAAIYLWRFVTGSGRNQTPTLQGRTEHRPVGRFHNRRKNEDGFR